MIGEAGRDRRARLPQSSSHGEGANSSATLNSNDGGWPDGEQAHPLSLARRKHSGRARFTLKPISEKTGERRSEAWTEHSHD
jgi:hypothetical protein